MTITVKEWAAANVGRSLCDYYCKKCGAELLLVEQPVGGYDSGTGQPVVRLKGVCPRRRGLLGFLHEGNGYALTIPPAPPVPEEPGK